MYVVAQVGTSEQRQDKGKRTIEVEGNLKAAFSLASTLIWALL